MLLVAGLRLPSSRARTGIPAGRCAWSCICARRNRRRARAPRRPEDRRTWQQQVIIDNRAGANGNIGSDIVAEANLDGYTMLLGTSGYFHEENEKRAKVVKESRAKAE
jgi:hypothetical protein